MCECKTWGGGGGGGGVTTHKPSSTLCEQLSSVLSPFLTVFVREHTPDTSTNYDSFLN